MRLVELLLVLVMEGRKALPKTSIPSMVAKRMDTFPGDRSHRQVIEAIRAGNNDEFYEAMDAGFDVNFMDDVGQTLLNWAAAFGTLEMVKHCSLKHDKCVEFARVGTSRSDDLYRLQLVTIHTQYFMIQCHIM